MFYLKAVISLFWIFQCYLHSTVSVLSVIFLHDKAISMEKFQLELGLNKIYFYLNFSIFHLIPVTALSGCFRVIITALFLSYQCYFYMIKQQRGRLSIKNSQFQIKYSFYFKYRLLYLKLIINRIWIFLCYFYSIISFLSQLFLYEKAIQIAYFS